jgi:hypothetical protein
MKMGKMLKGFFALLNVDKTVQVSDTTMRGRVILPVKKILYDKFKRY